MLKISETEYLSNSIFLLSIRTITISKKQDLEFRHVNRIQNIVFLENLYNLLKKSPQLNPSH